MARSYGGASIEEAARLAKEAGAADFMSEEEDEEAVRLAREEATATFNANRASAGTGPTNVVAGAVAEHIPQKAKEAMARTSDAIVNSEVHDGF